jgi:hypothetical protein
VERDEIVAVIRQTVEASVTRAGVAGIPVLSESGEQVAIDVVDALENAGFTIARTDESLR